MGKFVKGHRSTGGRPKGSQNKVSRTVKEALIEAGNSVGGREGMVGTFKKVAEKNIVAFGKMLADTIPLEVKADVAAQLRGPLEVRIVSIQHGDHFTKDQCDALTTTGEFLPGPLYIEKDQGVVPMIEHAPAPEPAAAALLSELNALSYEQLLDRARRAGLIDANSD